MTSGGAFFWFLFFLNDPAGGNIGPNALLLFLTLAYGCNTEHMEQILSCVGEDSSPLFGSLELIVAPFLFSSRPLFLVPGQTDICA